MNKEQLMDLVMAMKSKGTEQEILFRELDEATEVNNSAMIKLAEINTRYSRVQAESIALNNKFMAFIAQGMLNS